MALTLFRPGDKITAGRLNELIAEVKRIGNLKVSGDLEMQNNKNGIFIGLKPGIITIDEKYKQDNRANTATEWRRLSDLKRASVNSMWRILAIDDPQPEEEGEETPEATYRIMFLLDPELMTWDEEKKVEPGGWGGWLTTAAGAGLDKEEAYYEHEIPEPVDKNIAQLQTIVWLTDDDRDPDNNPTRDGNYHTYANIRHDAHFHKRPTKDGRLMLTDEPVGNIHDQYPLMGIFVCDPAVANTDTALGRESGQWRPLIWINLGEVPVDELIWNLDPTWVKDLVPLDYTVYQNQPLSFLLNDICEMINTLVSEDNLLYEMTDTSIPGYFAGALP